MALVTERLVACHAAGAAERHHGRRADKHDTSPERKHYAELLAGSAQYDRRLFAGGAERHSGTTGSFDMCQTEGMYTSAELLRQRHGRIVMITQREYIVQRPSRATRRSTTWRLDEQRIEVIPLPSQYGTSSPPAGSSKPMSIATSAASSLTWLCSPTRLRVCPMTPARAAGGGGSRSAPALQRRAVARGFWHTADEARNRSGDMSRAPSDARSGG
jgi:hypothetical protein